MQVTRVKTLPATLKTRIKLGKVKIGKGRKASISGRVLEDREPGPVGQGPRLLAAEARKEVEDHPRRPEAGQQAVHLQAEAQERRHLAREVKYVNVAPYKASTALSKTLRVKH